MAADPNNLIWIDMEMTGLAPDTDRIIEIAVLVTDSQLNLVAEGPVLVVKQPDEVLAAMDSWNTSVHAKSGLVGKVKASALDEASAERACLPASPNPSTKRSEQPLITLGWSVISGIAFTMPSPFTPRFPLSGLPSSVRITASRSRPTERAHW